MAYDILSEKHPSALAAANKVLKTLHDANPHLTVKEGDYPFVECATLADDIRMKGGDW